MLDVAAPPPDRALLACISLWPIGSGGYPQTSDFSSLGNKNFFSPDWKVAAPYPKLPLSTRAVPQLSTRKAAQTAYRCSE